MDIYSFLSFFSSNFLSSTVVKVSFRQRHPSHPCLFSPPSLTKHQRKHEEKTFLREPEESQFQPCWSSRFRLLVASLCSFCDASLDWLLVSCCYQVAHLSSQIGANPRSNQASSQQYKGPRQTANNDILDSQLASFFFFFLHSMLPVFGRGYPACSCGFFPCLACELANFILSVGLPSALPSPSQCLSSGHRGSSVKGNF